MTAQLLTETAGVSPAIARRSLAIVCTVAACAALLALALDREGHGTARSSAATSNIVSADHLDGILMQAATAALGDHEGTIIVMDPQTGRIHAVVNPQFAFNMAVAPGSTIKPFSALAGLRSGLIRKEPRIVCREHFTDEDFATVCSHPKGLAPLGVREAIAYSCNYYFGKLGEQLRAPSFNPTLVEFGFGQPTEVNWTGGRESGGKLRDGQWRAQNALGEGDQVLVTPIQLLAAYSALVNGGHLLSPRIASGRDFLAQPRADVAVTDEHRQQIIDGMRGAIRYGTAERSGLDSLPLYIFGKTGTSTQTGGFRTQGWFVGFASQLDDVSNQNPVTPQNVKLAVLIFVKRGHGSDAAELARPIFDAYVQATKQGDVETGGEGDRETREQGDGEMGRKADGFSPRLPISPSPRLPVAASSRLSFSDVRVHLVRENVTLSMPIEDYVLGVVASEGSTETEPQALKALAVAARTYAVKNLHRHASEGYDFCTTTHCQRFGLTDARHPASQVAPLIFNAVRQTAAKALYTDDAQIVDSYFSASCGGATANIGTLWRVKAPSYLTGDRDEYCVTGPHHNWTDVITSNDILKALKSDPRTDVGDRLVNVRVARRDASGRAELISIDGSRRRTLSGWDFKIIVGRALGWHLLKSSRFDIARSGSSYIFRGSGFGHGLGLCQEGAHVMARRGASYQQILEKYFPATHVENKAQILECADCGGALDLTFMENHGTVNHLNPKRRRAAPAAALQRTARASHHVFSKSPISINSQHAVATRSVSSARRALSSEHFRISYPKTVNDRDAEHILRVVESSRNDLIRRVAAAGVLFQFPTLEIFINETTGDFVGRTGQPPWAAAAARGNRVELQPVELLKRRRILETTLRHELVHVLIDALGHGRTPRWLAEGLAIHIAGEGPTVSRYLRKVNISIPELEQKLSQPASVEDMRVAYAASYDEVRRLIRTEGEAAIWRRVDEMRN